MGDIRPCALVMKATIVYAHGRWHRNIAASAKFPQFFTGFKIIAPDMFVAIYNHLGFCHPRYESPDVHHVGTSSRGTFQI